MKRSGFSMIELVFVIVILGVLAAVAVPRFVATRTDAQVATARSDMASAMKAIVAKIFADNIDPNGSKAPRPDVKASAAGSQTMEWGDWIVEISGLDGSRWAKGGALITAARAGGTGVLQPNQIQPLGNVTVNGKTAKGGCGGVLGIEVTKGYMVFAPNNITPGRGAFCEILQKSYENSTGAGNRLVPLASTQTIEF